MTVVTVIIPVSPIVSHPDTAILDETIESIRFHHPDAEILITFDGVRPEQKHRRQDYEEHIQRVLWKADHDPLWRPVCPFIFEEHRHQSGMLKAVIDEIRTPLLLYVEADCPLVTDEPIDWGNITDFITSGASNLVRLHHEGVIPEAHKHMMLQRTKHYNDHDPDNDWRPRSIMTYMQTVQWSQRPHIASTAYYRRILDAHFSPDSRCFIEDRMHGIVDNAYRRDGIQGWNQHRLHIYHPDTGNIKRSYTTDGRAGEPKYDATQLW